jgi:hypothetical protein
VLHYLKAVEALNAVGDGRAVTAKMKERGLAVCYRADIGDERSGRSLDEGANRIPTSEK